jgi:hypothetical protein
VSACVPRLARRLACACVAPQNMCWAAHHTYGGGTCLTASNKAALARNVAACRAGVSVATGVDSANAYHSDAGVLAMIAQVVDLACPLPSERKPVTQFQPKEIH